MNKLWITTVLDGKITRNIVADWDGKQKTEDALNESLEDACDSLNLSMPIIMKKHISELNSFRRTKFLPEHFIESVDFDRMELEIYDSKKNKKHDSI
jgi:hypothetical protein